MDEQLARHLLSQLSTLDSRLGALDRDVREALEKMDELEEHQHEHSKEILLLQGRRELGLDAGPGEAGSTSHKRHLPTAAVGGGVAAGGLLGLLIDRIIAFLLGW